MLKTFVGILGHTSCAESVIWTAEKINNLDVSKKAKKIIGKDFIVTDWNTDSDALGAYLIGKINNKRYKVELVLALMMGEILSYSAPQ